MRNFVKMLRDTENMRQDTKLASLVKNRKPVGFFNPATDERYFLMGVELSEALLSQGVNVVYMCVLDEVAPRFRKYDIKVNLITMSDIYQVKCAEEILVWNVYEIWAPWMYTYFEKNNIPTYIVEDDKIFWKRRDWFYDHIVDMYDVYSDFNDEKSKKTFMGVLKYNMTGQLREYIMAEEPQYMLYGYGPRKGDVVIDGGAYDGSTAVDFVKYGAKVYAFEMDKINYKKAKGKSEQYGFELVNKGLGAVQEERKYMTNDAGSMVNENGNEIAEFIDIDSWVEEKGIKRIDFIKMDIEGAEMEALKGACRTICACKPRMAICAYHKWEDLFRLQKYIKSLRKDYEFAFRHYPINGNLFLDETLLNVYKHYDMDMQIPCMWEYVLYAR